ncbi:PREDICTED: tetratricopeptide repeat protein 21B-like [Priapulus caudatus]|uniref:Tetratricopeptide repeat protein 21B-like n=1 Tax=Priapulus caudatus TaxID=37621 RepID=A0ABM1E8A1_PRICU|nr:PREDICTED: tetratricopeptide repeat protein 21B-like [Priapulus caudatus]
MADVDAVTLGKVSYYLREKYIRHAHNAIHEGLKKYGNDPVLRFFNAYVSILEDRIQEGMRELESIKGIREVMLCSILALQYAHRLSTAVDREALEELDARLKQERRGAGEKALYFAALFLFHVDRVDKAREYIDKMLKIDPYNPEGNSLKGWIELASGKDIKKAGKHFEDSLSASPPAKNLDGLFGKASYLASKHNYSGALETLNQLVVAFPQFVPTLVEKMKIQVALQTWEDAIETAHRALGKEPRCIEAKKFLLVFQIAREGQLLNAVEAISDLMRDIDMLEPKNAQLYYDVGKLIARIVGRDEQLLVHTYTFIERAAQLENIHADYVTELGHQCLLQERYKDALKCFRNAMRLDETNVQALTGQIRVQLLLGQVEEAQQQLEFLKEVQATIGKSAELSYLGAVLALKQRRPHDVIVPLFNEAIEAHFAQLRGLPLGDTYYCMLNPDLLMCIVKDYLTLAPGQPASSGQPMISPVLKKCSAILDPVVRLAPGLVEGLYLMAKVKFLIGDVDLAQASLNHCLELDNRFADAHLLMAQIYLQKEEYSLTNQSLEVALSHNFAIREHPIYHLIKARAQKKLGNIEEAAKTLKTAMGLPGVKLHGSGPQEVHLIAMHSNPVNVAADEQYYIEAREKMAYIYLHHRKDKRLYASCYRELVEKNPTPQTCLLLGDAYMSIQEPERAIDVYEQALKTNPRDSALASKIGQALVQTHNYGKAINYYEKALQSGNKNYLRYDLADLLLKLRQYDRAERELEAALTRDQGGERSAAVDGLLLLPVFPTQPCLTLPRVLFLCRVLNRVQVEQPDSVSASKQMAADICVDIAEHATTSRDMGKASKFYKEALIYREGDSKIMLALAKLYLQLEDLDSCMQTCTTLLKSDKNNNAATVMMADLMFRKNEFETSTFHFQQLLERNPDHYEALSRMIQLLRRIGTLEDTPHYLKLAEHHSPRATIHPGFNYCQGLYSWYSGDANTALKHFNMARRDSEWGDKALHCMIEICLNPDNNTIGGETFEGVDADLSSGDADQMALKTASKLIQELKQQPGDVRPQILHNKLLIATKDKSNVERALQSFMQICSAEGYRDQVGALHGMATAYMVLKQAPKARNQLKLISKKNWTFEDAEDLEKSWLLLADIYIQSGKYDMSTELLKRCVQHNKSCSKAYEYMGYIMEKESAYKDAAKSYELAWKHSNKSNPSIGYKLAFNYLKAKRYVEAIDVCRHVLEQHPTYPKIRKDILEKARANLRI